MRTLLRIVCWFRGHQPEALGGIYENVPGNRYPYTVKVGTVDYCKRCSKRLGERRYA